MRSNLELQVSWKVSNRQSFGWTDQWQARLKLIPYSAVDPRRKNVLYSRNALRIPCNRCLDSFIVNIDANLKELSPLQTGDGRMETTIKPAGNCSTTSWQRTENAGDLTQQLPSALEAAVAKHRAALFDERPP